MFEARRIRANDGDQGGGGLPQRRESELFALGRTVITSNAQAQLRSDDVQAALYRHHRGDCGELDAQAWQANQTALQDGLRLLSVYRDQNQTKFYIITEWDRSITTILLPEDY